MPPIQSLQSVDQHFSRKRREIEVIYHNEHLPLGVARKVFSLARGTEARNDVSDSSHKDSRDRSKNGCNEFRRQQYSGTRNEHAYEIQLKLGLKVASIRFNCKQFRESTILDGKLPKSI